MIEVWPMMGFPAGSQIVDIERLPAGARQLFAILVCERLVPNFRRFAEEAGWSVDTFDRLRTAIDRMWQSVAGESVPEDLEIRATELLALAPDTNAFRSDYVSAALDAVTAVAEGLMACSKPTTERIAEIADLGYESARMYVIHTAPDSHATLKESSVEGHPLILQEVNRQHADLQWIKERWPLRQEELNDLKRLVRQRYAAGNLVVDLDDEQEAGPW